MQNSRAAMLLADRGRKIYNEKREYHKLNDDITLDIENFPHAYIIGNIANGQIRADRVGMMVQYT